jgi:hypothetical protein
MMLGREDERLETGALRLARPLPSIECSWIEEGRALGPVTPFAIGEGVDAEMEELRPLGALVAELRRRGPWPHAWQSREKETRAGSGGCEEKRATVHGMVEVVERSRGREVEVVEDSP